MVRLALAIGVDKTGDLPPLRDAAASAVRVADWLEAEGFEVELKTDRQNPVTASDLFQVVTDACEGGRCEQLLIYFSGHGYLQDGSEHWLLSHAPQNANEAVRLDENIVLARDSGIPSVIFISDACRSTPQSLRADRVRGSLIFPNHRVSRTVRADVDRLFACLPGDPAFETPVDESSRTFRGLYTDCLTGAYRDTSSTYCREVNGVEVLPNRLLKKLMPLLVEQAALRISPTLVQRPDTIVESDENTFIARVLRTAPSSPGSDAPAPSPPAPPPRDQQSIAERFSGFTKTIFGRFGWSGRDDVPGGADVSRQAPRQGGITLTRANDLDSLLISRELGLDLPPGARPEPDAQQQAAIRAAANLPDIGGQLDRRRGIAIRGAEVAEVRGLGCEAHLLHAGEGDADAVITVAPSRLSDPSPFENSVIVRFRDGSGTVLAAPDNFFCRVIVDQDKRGNNRTDGVTQVSWIPTPRHPRWPDFVRHQASVGHLQAFVAGMARIGAFKIERDQASALASAAAPGSMTDPTLCMFAVYALNAIGMADHVSSLAAGLQDSLGGRLLYDVALLARREHRIDSRVITPFCPMLSSGWQLLNIFGGELPFHVAEASLHRRATLWTTFDKTGMDILMNGEAAQ